MNINGQTKILGILGYPVKHSFSPLIHNYLIEKFKLNMVYIPFEIQKNNFNGFIQGIKKAENFKGFNITVPYKTSVMKHLDFISKDARAINAVNTVKINNNKWAGFNTDHTGFIKSIEFNFKNFSFKNKRILILGAGGTAKAVAFALLKTNVKQLVLLNRTYEKAQNLKTILKRTFKKNSIIVEKLHFDYLKNPGTLPDMIINTTSIGLKKDDKALLDLKYLKGKKTIVFDLIYNPARTLLLKNAVQYGLPVLNGLDMLILQALESFSLWNGINFHNKLLKKEISFLRQRLIKILT